MHINAGSHTTHLNKELFLSLTLCIVFQATFKFQNVLDVTACTERMVIISDVCVALVNIQH